MGCVTYDYEPTKFSVCVHCNSVLVTTFISKVIEHMNNCRKYNNKQVIYSIIISITQDN